MRELINVIPYLDVFIVVLLAFFLYLGWNHGMPRLAMIIGAIYTGFLLASIYYHLFAVVLSKAFKMRASFVTDLISFLVLDALITILMIALLLTLFGHIEIKGRAAAFDKLGGTVMGFFAGILVIGILITLLRVPYEANKQNLDASSKMPVVQLFNDGYEKSALSPYFVKAAPWLVYSISPMLPPQMQDKGAVPLLQSLVAQQ